MEDEVSTTTSTTNMNVSGPINLLHISNEEVEDEMTQLISHETSQTISKILLYGVSPLIGTLGVTWNILSIIVLLKQGLHKCSNILLVSLAFMDTSFLVGYNSVPYLLYVMQGGGRFLYSESVSLFLYVLYFVFIVMDYGLGLAGLCIPMLITVERLVAVFIPLKFASIITPKRTWITVGGVAIFWVVSMAYTCFWYEFDYAFDEKLNRSVGLILKSDLFYKDFDGIPIFQEIYFSMKLPPLITVVGCVAIIVKVKMTSVKRGKMTSSKVASTSKTTQMLLAVCFAYLLICVVTAVPSYLPKEMSAYSLTTDRPTNVGILIYQLMCLFASINSSWNFLVYVGLNKNFRDTFKEIMTQPCRRK